MAQIRVEQIADLGIVTDENGVKHIVIGNEVVTPIEGITVVNVVEQNSEDDAEGVE